MRTDSRNDAALVAAVLAGVLLAASVPVALGADPTTPSSGPAPARAAEATLEARAQRATLQLYALEARLARTRAMLAGIAARRSEVERRQGSLERHLGVARAALRVSEARLGELLRALYQQSGTTEPLEIVLGAGSLDEALAGLDSLDRAAGQSAEIVEQARASRLRLRAVQVRLARRAAELRQLAAGAETEQSELATAVAERRVYIADLRRQELSAARVAQAHAQARAAAARTTAAVPAARDDEDDAEPVAAAPVAPVRAGVAGATLTVTSTGYVLRGHTASGVLTGPGVVAVDPTVIPLGTRMTVPGYGEAIAADTGGAVIGNTIDLWFATLEEAHRWGRRTVTITLH